MARKPFRNDFTNAVNKHGIQKGSDLKEFHTYLWILTSEQKSTVAEWQRQAVVTQSQRAKAQKHQALKDREETANSGKRKSDQPMIMAPPLNKKAAPAASSFNESQMVMAMTATNFNEL